MHLQRLHAGIGAARALGALRPDPRAGDEGAAVMLHDLDHLDRVLGELQAAFPPHALHAVAVKANPVGPLLDHVAARGLGLECASSVELRLALDRLPPERVVFDSPCKTWDDLRTALQAGVHLNVDGFQELDRIEELMAQAPSRATVGLRVNPDVGAGAIAATSTAVKGSKFGVDAVADREEILARFARCPWLVGLHCHVGSQGCELSLLAAGAAAIVELALEIEARGGRVQVLDIGGGLPAAYGEDDDEGPGFAALVAELQRQAPEVLTGRWRLVTEFGRRIWSAGGVAVSRVEATKVSGGRRIAVLHFGADLFVRATYRPAQWRHRITVHHPDGTPKQGPRMPWDVVGPLCFSGDRLAKGRQLPPIEPGDLVAVHDAGAYTLAMYSRYNSRRAPAVVGLQGSPPAGRLLLPAESTEDVLRFWQR